jgi:hypothetical protein
MQLLQIQPIWKNSTKHMLRCSAEFFSSNLIHPVKETEDHTMTQELLKRTILNYFRFSLWGFLDVMVMPG